MNILRYDDLPGPDASWFGLLQLRDMARDYLGLLERYRHEHGDVVRLRVVRERTLDLFDPELVRRLMVDHADDLIRWERGTEVFAESVGQSVLVTEGATWQRQRRMLMQAFTPKKVAGYAALMAEAGEAGLNAQRPGDVAMDGLFAHLTMDVISRTLFSRPISSTGTNTTEAAAAVQRLSEIGLGEMFWPMTLPDWLPLPGKAIKRRALRLINGLLHERIEERRRSGQARNDLLGMLLALRDEEGGGALSEQEVFDQCMLSFQAGHETSATALLWWSWLMARHPEAQQRAAEEIGQLQGHAPTPEDQARLPWLTATLKEAMRLYPPAAALLTRRLKRDILLPLPDGSQLQLPARTMVRITPWLLHRDRRWWLDADAFRPERFLPGATEGLPRGAYLPFGLGPRACLGQHFAMLEMQVLAAQLLQRFHLSTVPGAAEPVPRLAVTLRPAGGLRLKLEAA